MHETIAPATVDVASRNAIVEANMGLVYQVARGFEGPRAELEDLVQDGALGLMRAAEKFDPDRGIKFSTYAVYWIRQAIGRGLGSRDVVDLPYWATIAVGKYRKAARRIDGTAGEPDRLDPGAILDAMGVSRPLSRRSVRAAVAHAGRAYTGNLGILEGLPDPSTLEGSPARPDELAALRRALAPLARRERLILTLRRGLDGGGERTLREVGRELGLSPERVRQIQDRAEATLRETLQPTPRPRKEHRV